jgi:hypothetical protein
MRKVIISLVVAISFLIVAWTAQADIIVDTGWNSAAEPYYGPRYSLYTISSSSYEWFAAKFTTDKDYYVKEMQGYIRTGSSNGDITVGIFNNVSDKPGGTARFAYKCTSVGDTNTSAWQGSSGHIDFLPQGT